MWCIGNTCNKTLKTSLLLSWLHVQISRCTSNALIQYVNLLKSIHSGKYYNNVVTGLAFLSQVCHCARMKDTQFSVAGWMGLTTEIKLSLWGLNQSPPFEKKLHLAISISFFEVIWYPLQVPLIKMRIIFKLTQYQTDRRITLVQYTRVFCEGRRNIVCV